MSDSKAVDTRSMTLEPSDTEPSKGSGKSTYLPGEFIHERYEVVKLLGKGSNGTVYQVKDHKVGTTVAVKLICASARNESGAASRLHHEIRIAYSVKSDYITNLYSMFSDDHHIGLVLEYVNGQSLYSYLQAHTVFTIRDVINIGRQIALGLQRIHCAGIIHRDLKLENILLDESGMAKITDFGVSILQSSLIEEVPSEEISPDQLKRRATEAGKVVGTLHYLSPEYLSKRIFDVRTDIYALGVVLYELTTCIYPFKFSSPRQLVEKKLKEDPPPPSHVRHDCPLWLDEVILKAMARDPEKRFQSAQELHDVLAPHLRTLAVTERTKSPLRVRLRRIDLGENLRSTEYQFLSLNYMRNIFERTLGNIIDIASSLVMSLFPERSFRTFVLSALVLGLLSISIYQKYYGSLNFQEHLESTLEWAKEFNPFGSGPKSHKIRYTTIASPKH